MVRRKNAGNGGGVIAWVALLFTLTLAGALPFIAAGLSPEQLPRSSTLLPLILAGIILTAYAPTLAALIVAARTGGVRALLRQLGTWRVGVGWYALVLIGPFTLILLADLIHAVWSGSPPGAWLVFPSSLAFVGPLVAGSLGEELGWRGFAQPRLQARYSALRASIVIGFIWGTWHLWPAITPGGFSDLTPSDVAQTYVRLVSTAIIYAWIYNSTNGSLFLVMVAHAGHNLATDLVRIPAEAAQAVPAIVALLYLAAATAVVLVAGSTLCRPLPTKTRGAATRGPC